MQIRLMGRIFTGQVSALPRILLLGVALLAGCTLPLATPAPPDWVLNPPADTPDEFWGVGDGYSLDVARGLALRTIASRLRVNISGAVQNQTTVRNNAVDTTAQSRVSEVVQETEFSNVTVVKTQQRKDGFYVLVKVDRNAFIKQVKAKFENYNQLVEQKIASFDQKSPIDQFISIKSALPHLEKALENGYLLRVADPSFTKQVTISRLEGIKQEVPAAAERVVVFLEYAPRDEDIARAVTDSLNDYGMRVSATDKRLILKINTSSRQELLFGNSSYILSVTLQLKNDKLQNIASRQYQLFGNSLENFDLARQDAVKQLNTLMKTEGVELGLGLKN